MRFIVHTPDGETYTAPDGTYPHIEEGAGALHIIQDGGEWRTIAVFPEGQWTRYVPADAATQDEQWLGPVAAVWSAIEAKSKQLSKGQGSNVGDAAALYRAYLNATKRNIAGYR